MIKLIRVRVDRPPISRCAGARRRAYRRAATSRAARSKAGDGRLASSGGKGLIKDPHPAVKQVLAIDPGWSRLCEGLPLTRSDAVTGSTQ